MSVTELMSSVQFVVDAEGNKKAVQIDLAAWKEIVEALRRAGQTLELDDLLAGITEENWPGEVETMALTEPILQRDWVKPEEDKAWAHL